MTIKKLGDIVVVYKQYLKEKGIPVHEFPKEGARSFVIEGRINKGPQSVEHALSHCHWMLEKMEEFINKGDIDKAFRWLGFIQGVFWYAGVFSIRELVNHNRSDIFK